MGLLTEILLLPLAPVRSVTWLAEKIRDEADRQMPMPDDLQAELEELDRLRESGELSPEEADLREEELLRAQLGPDEGDDDE
jgi:hypothetical protein